MWGCMDGASGMVGRDRVGVWWVRVSMEVCRDMWWHGGVVGWR